MATTIAEISAQLKLNNANFKKGLTGAQKSMRGFQNQVKQMRNMIVGAFTVTAAIATFKKAIASTQSTADSFARTMEAAREATTQLLASVASGEWKGLVQNMQNAAKAGKEYADAMDEVSDRSRSIRIQTALAQKNLFKLREVATDTSRTDAERIKAYKEILRLTSTQIKAEKQIAEDALDAQIQKQITRNGLTQEQGELIKNFVTNYEDLTGKELESVRNVTDLKDAWDAANKKVSQLSQQGLTGNMLSGYAIAADEAEEAYKQQLSTLTDVERQYLDINSALNKLTDEEREGIANVIIEGAKLEQKLQSLQNEAVRGVGSIESKSVDAAAAVDDVTDSVNDLGEAALEVEDWMSDFWKATAPQTLGDDTKGSAKSALDGIVESLTVDFPDAAEEAISVGGQVAYMLTNQFNAMGQAIAGAVSGIKGSLASLGMAILDNIGSILIMAGLATSPIGWPLVIAGAAIQLGGGLFKGLSNNVNTGGAGGGGEMRMRVEGKDLVTVLNRNSTANNMNT